MPQILFLRHAQAVANEQGILMGSSLKVDSPLSDKGIETARRKGGELRKASFVPDKVFCSKLNRSKQTTDIILEELGVKTEIIQLAELNERDFGQYDGKPYNFVLEAFEQHGDNPPTIEPVDAFEKRVIKGFETIKQQTTKTTLVVSHSNPVMVIQTYVYKPENLQNFWEQGDPDYCEGFIYDF